MRTPLSPPAALRALTLVLAATLSSAAEPSAPDSEPTGWLRIDYGALVDRRRLTHSGDPVGVVLDRLGGRPRPATGSRSMDALGYRLLDPLLEPYAFVLPDTLDAMAPPSDPPMVEVGGLWESGEPQPAWVELVRARRYTLESDGEGHLRACLPASALEALPDGGAPPPLDPVATAKAAWQEAWPVLRHALAGERSRLARRGGADAAILAVEVHAYRHVAARTSFVLGVAPYRVTVGADAPGAPGPGLDLGGLARALDRGWRIEGARLEPSGKVNWLFGDPETAPTLLGRALTIADFAVAYRAIARGGYGEPYMSLDRALSPHLAEVNYGGRLRDTSLGMVSLLADVRFKTFSVGVDMLGSGDIRDKVRASLPEFRTHLERFARDAGSGAVLDQQTKFWFYPDDVDLTVSAEGDVLAFRRVRMTAASERVQDAASPEPEAAWTRATVAFLNENYDRLAAVFPELSDLDESIRLLALFTWLEAARERGLHVPDLDALLAVELPATPTPRRFPQLLTYDVLPPPGAEGIVEVLDRTAVGQALDRLEPEGLAPLSPARRFRRALALLSAQIPDQAALAREMEERSKTADAATLDLLASRAERLLMHARVIATIPESARAAVDARRKADPGTRAFSVGIGGVDLGLGAVFERAASKGGGRLGMSAVPDRDPAKPAPPGSAAGSGARSEAAAASTETRVLVASPWPDHGLGRDSERVTTSVGDGRGRLVSTRRPGALVRRGSWTVPSGAAVGWTESIQGIEGTEPRARRRIADPDGRTPVFERFEDGRWLGYRFERAGGAMKAVEAARALPDEALGPPPTLPAEPVADALPPPGPVRIEILDADATSVRVRLRGENGTERTAALPRPLLQRLVLGHEADLVPERPLMAFTPASQVVGTTGVAMVMQRPGESQAPWEAPVAPYPGEESAARLASALVRWWGSEPGSTGARAVVGTDPSGSLKRWRALVPLDGKIAVSAPADAFPGRASTLKGSLDALASDPGASRLVMLVSAEPAGLLGRRLRALANDPAMRGKILAVVALGASLRPDLPGSLLEDGQLGALGVFESGPIGWPRAVEAAARWAGAAGSKSAGGTRPEDIPGPFTWFY